MRNKIFLFIIVATKRTMKSIIGKPGFEKEAMVYKSADNNDIILSNGLLQKNFSYTTRILFVQILKI